MCEEFLLLASQRQALFVRRRSPPSLGDRCYQRRNKAVEEVDRQVGGCYGLMHKSLRRRVRGVGGGFTEGVGGSITNLELIDKRDTDKSTSLQPAASWSSLQDFSRNEIFKTQQGPTEPEHSLKLENKTDLCSQDNEQKKLNLKLKKTYILEQSGTNKEKRGN